MEVVEVTILGAAGLIGARHVEHVLRDPHFHLHSIVDPTESGEKLGLKLKVPVFKSLDSLVSSFPTSIPRAAIIATPSHLHTEQAIQLLRNGIHLLIEKPVCTTIESGMELLDASRNPGAGSVLSGYHRRFNPYAMALKEMLDSGVLGRVVAVQGTWAVLKPAEYFSSAPWRTQEGSGGTLLLNMSHEIDMLRYLFGEVSRVYLELGPSTRGYEVDETGAATLRFASGLVGTFIFSDSSLSPFSFEAATGENPTLIPHSGENVYRILGTHGSVELPSLKRYHCGGGRQGNWTDKLVTDEGLSPQANPDRFSLSEENLPFSKRLEHWLEVIRSGRTPACTARDGVMATVIIEALRRSSKTRLPVDIRFSLEGKLSLN